VFHFATDLLFSDGDYLTLGLKCVKIGGLGNSFQSNKMVEGLVPL